MGNSTHICTDLMHYAYLVTGTYLVLHARELTFKAVGFILRLWMSLAAVLAPRHRPARQVCREQHIDKTLYYLGFVVVIVIISQPWGAVGTIKFLCMPTGIRWQLFCASCASAAYYLMRLKTCWQLLRSLRQVFR